jgi:hypothetical protein
MRFLLLALLVTSAAYCAYSVDRSLDDTPVEKDCGMKPCDTKTAVIQPTSALATLYINHLLGQADAEEWAKLLRLSGSQALLACFKEAANEFMENVADADTSNPSSDRYRSFPHWLRATGGASNAQMFEEVVAHLVDACI